MEQKKYKILIVDDHLLIRQMVTMTLNRAGQTSVETANDSATALHKLKSAASSEPFDIMFLDWSMPNQNGFDLLLLCRRDEQLDDMAIIMLTSESGEVSVKKALEAGANAYITKPFRPEEILKKFEDVERWRALQSKKRRTI